jgi:hypothetical protein
MRKLVSLLIVFCILFNEVAKIDAWGAEGHMIIAQIAWDRLTNNAQNIADEFLGSDTLPDIAPLPDDYDHTDQGKWSEPCHFCNLPKDATNFTMEYCPDYCVVKSIQNYTHILSTEQNSPFECDYDLGVEPCALEFLVHFVGDVHQPLHVSYAYDRGGNDVKVSFYGEDTNLHAVWDDKMIQRWNSDYSSATTELEDMIENEPALVQQYLSRMNPITWADESFAYVLSTVYNFTDSDLGLIDADGLSEDFLPKQDPQLGDAYYNRNLPIVKQRLIAGGVRLAALLDSIMNGSY